MNRLKRLALCSVVVVVLILVLTAGPARAQDSEYFLFDTFSFAFEGSWVTLDSKVRLDSELLGIGTEIDFESDGGLDDSKMIPSLSVNWRFAKRHRIGGWWQNIDRSNTEQILTEIRFGDFVFPIDEPVKFTLDVQEFGITYTYLFMIKERLALGIGGGLRTLRIDTSLAAVDIEISEGTDFTQPLPFILGEFRAALARKLRFVSTLGFLYIEIDNLKGSQFVIDADIEHLTFKRVSLGAGLRGTWVDAEDERLSFRGEVDLAIVSAKVFAKIRF